MDHGSPRFVQEEFDLPHVAVGAEEVEDPITVHPLAVQAVDHHHRPRDGRRAGRHVVLHPSHRGAWRTWWDYSQEGGRRGITTALNWVSATTHQTAGGHPGPSAAAAVAAGRGPAGRLAGGSPLQAAAVWQVDGCWSSAGLRVRKHENVCTVMYVAGMQVLS